jgi:DNA repair protein RecN (Recombination protein N)
MAGVAGIDRREHRMIEEISIRGLGVIDEATVTWGPGLTVLTGETGAGKTMVLTALGLLLGDKADASLVRDDATQLEVEAVVTDVPEAVRMRVEDAGGSVDDGHLVLARTVTKQRSRAFAGGRSVPAGLLSEVGEELVAVHGQDDQAHLRRTSRQREVVDRFAGGKHLELLRGHRVTWDELRRARAELAELSSGSAARAERRTWLERGLADVDQLHLVPGEDEALRVRIERTQNVDALMNAAVAARSALSGDADSGDSSTLSGAVELVSRARKALEAHLADDAALADLAQRAASLAAELDALAADVGGFLEALEADPDLLQASLDRRGALREARRRWVDADPAAPDACATLADHADALLAWAANARADLARGDDDTRLKALGEQLAALEARQGEQARSLAKGRRAAAKRLALQVTAELAQLGMSTTRFVVVVEDADAGPDGADEVTFGLIAHEGAAPVPVHRGASGGERSRVMLALEVVLASADPVPTFVFDEVDAGVGGEAALAVGQRLATLGATAQVLVVTHLPQVAAFADRHLVVSKGSSSGITTSDIREVVDADRAVELARMLAGMSDSDVGRAHAEELVHEAQRRRQAVTR